MARKRKGPVVRRKPGCERAGLCAPQWLRECAADTPRAMLCGREYLAVENCGRVTRFEPDCVCLRTAQGEIMVLGQELVISRESLHTAVIRGRIAQIRLGGDA